MKGSRFLDVMNPVRLGGLEGAPSILVPVGGVAGPMVSKELGCVFPLRACGLWAVGCSLTPSRCCQRAQGYL